MNAFNSHLKFIVTIFIALFLFNPLYSQPGNSNEITHGSEYWLGVPHCRTSAGEPIRNGEYPVMLWISSKVATRATVSADLVGFYKTVQVNPHKTTIIELDDYLMNRESEKVEDKGIHIIADDPITVCVYMAYKWSGEAFRCIPVEWLGKNYVSTNLYLEKVETYKPAQILIVATEDNTTVTYTPTAHTVKVSKGNTGSVSLKKGQTFLIEGRIKGQEFLKQDWVTDLTGTQIASNKPIAVISGHTKGAFSRFQTGMPSNYQLRWANFIRNMLIEMMWPNELLGQDYISAPIKYFNRTRGLSGVSDDFGDLIRFVAVEDQTVIYQMRQDGSSLKKISPTLKKGQFYNILNQELAAYYWANKPVLAAQYGKSWMNENVPGNPNDFNKKKEDQPLNPHLSGQGMLIILTPISHWCSYAQFRSPAGIDNFIYITFEDKDRFKIYFDDQPISAKFGTAVRPIYGTDYVYLTETVGPGDHHFSADSGVKFAAYAYGNWDRTKDGFAYGYPTGINYASKCDDTLLVKYDDTCGNVTGEAWVEPEDSSCAIIFSVLFKSSESYNYEFEVDEFDPASAKRVGFTLTVIDPADSAFGIVTVMTRSGKTKVMEFKYVPERIEADPGYIDFGMLVVGETKCMKVLLKNPISVPVTVKSIRLKDNKPEFEIKTPIPPEVVIPPFGEHEIEICATALAVYTESVKDSIIAELSCYERGIVELELRSGEPIVWISDQDWGSVAVNVPAPVAMPVRIENRGSTDAELTDIDWPDKVHWTKVDNLDFPLIIKKGKNHIFNAYYKPTQAGVKDSTRAVFTANTEKIKLYSDWIGIGIDAGPSITPYNWFKKRVIDQHADSTEYHGVIEIGNVSDDAVLKVIDVIVENDPDGVFRVDKTNMPQFLNELQIVPMDVWFAPKAEKVYVSDITFIAEFGADEKRVSAKLEGIGTWPHVSIDDHHFEDTILVGTTSTEPTPLSTWVFSNETSMDLEVYDLLISGTDASYFEIDPQFFIDHPYPITFAPNDPPIDVPLIFTPDLARDFRAVITTDSDAEAEDSGNLLAHAKTEGIVPTDRDFGTHYVSLDSTDTVSLTNFGSETIQVELPFVSGNDINQFRLNKYYIQSTGIEPTSDPIDLPSNDALICEVTFTPDADRRFDAKIDYSTSVGDAVSILTGGGKYYYMWATIPNTYKTLPGKAVNVEYKVYKDPDEKGTKFDANILAFDAYVTYKSSANSTELEVFPEIDGNLNEKDGIQTTNTLTEGWTLEVKELIDNFQLHVRFVQNDPSKPLNLTNKEQVLFRFNFFSYLSDLSIIPLPVEFYPEERPWVLVDTIPGQIEIAPICVNTLRLVKLSNTNFALQQSSPNPANEQAVIRYSVGFETRTTIELYNSFGKKVSTLVNENLKPGSYELKINITAMGLPSGVYQYRMRSGPFEDKNSMVISR